MSVITAANSDKSQCAALAAIYATAVIIGGQGPFNGKKVNSLGMQAIVRATDSPIAAAALFSQLAKDSQVGKLDLSTIQIKDDKLVYKSLTKQNAYYVYIDKSQIQKIKPLERNDIVKTLGKVRQ